MNKLLSEIIDAHGGMTRWKAREKVEATIVTGGGFFALKGLIQDAETRRMTVWLHEERSSVLPYGAPDQRTVFTPERIAVEKLDGTVVAERLAPSDSFEAHLTPPRSGTFIYHSHVDEPRHHRAGLAGARSHRRCEKAVGKSPVVRVSHGRGLFPARDDRCRPS